MYNLIDNLKRRDMIHDISSGTVEKLTTPSTFYLGIDPTSSSLHVGHLSLFKLADQLIEQGHRFIVVLGGGTSMIGDPSFKASERKLLDRATIAHNQACIEKQVRHFFSAKNKESVQILNNDDWLSKIDLISFFRSFGKCISVNYILAKEAIKIRLEKGLSFTEFLYPLLQAYDFYYLHKHYGACLQIGGSDQWGNITAGIELSKKLGKEVFGLTIPLLTKADGTKFGKTEQGNVWLDAKKTSPYHFYQFWINVSDKLVPTLLKRLTSLPLTTIDSLLQAHSQSPEKRIAQKELAKYMTSIVHSSEACRLAEQTSKILFDRSNRCINFTELKQSMFLDAMQGLPHIVITQGEKAQVRNVLDLLTIATQGKIFPSKRAAREMIKGGGVRINNLKVTDPDDEVVCLSWLWDKYLLVQKGKRNYYLVNCQD